MYAGGGGGRAAAVEAVHCIEYTGVRELTGFGDQLLFDTIAALKLVAIRFAM